MKHHAIVLPIALALTLQGAVIAQKKPLTSADDLPRRTYQLKGTVESILEDEAQLDRLAGELLKNLQRDLDTFDIQDKATQIGYKGLLLSLYLRQGAADKVLELVKEMRALETKPSAKLTSGLFAEVLVETRRQVPDEASPAFAEAFEKNYFAAVSRLPFAEIKEYVDSTRAQAQMMKRELVIAGVKSGIQPLLDKTAGEVPEGVVAGLINTHTTLRHRLPLNDEIDRALGRLVEGASVVAKKDIWKEREATLDPAGLTPVTVAIWDSGVDLTSLPDANRFVNARESQDGKDNDRNGWVDDVHGIAFDTSTMRREPDTLDQEYRTLPIDIDRLHRLFKGSFYTASGLTGPEVDEFRSAYAGLKPEQVKEFNESLSYYTVFMHGTHVAGIAIAGNPAARVLAVRMRSPYKQPLPVYTMQKAQWVARTYRDVVSYLRESGVRVVNMSWRYTAASIEGALTLNNVGRDAAERKALARKMFEVEKSALYEAIKSAPGILFVCGSGNEDNDADFSEYIPASFNLPNLVTVGAVDVSGRKTSFTTEGKSVDFYAGGHLIESFVPRGKRMLMSGTSMSSPQVANLAAKLLAVRPSLTPSEVISLIDKGAEPSDEDPRIKLINPKKSLALLQR
jgi:subtilisin family serine protease